MSIYVCEKEPSSFVLFWARRGSGLIEFCVCNVIGKEIHLGETRSLEIMHWRFYSFYHGYLYALKFLTDDNRLDLSEVCENLKSLINFDISDAACEDQLSR
jgi:hypothetical protein